MAQSKCANCNGARFEAVKGDPTDSPMPIYFIQCAACGAVVGVVPAPIEKM